MRYDRGPLLVPLVLLPAVAWIWIVVMARDMYGPMTGASAWMMSSPRPESATRLSRSRPGSAEREATDALSTTYA